MQQACPVVSSTDVITKMGPTHLLYISYTDFKEKQNIEFNDKGQSLYSSGDSKKYISENKNMDICVSDCFARTVVVVGTEGEFKFIYPGFSSTMKLFNPHGITTDGQIRILSKQLCPCYISVWTVSVLYNWL